MVRKSKEDYLIQSVCHALDILEEFQGDADELGVTELSNRLKLHKNNIFRLLATLEVRGHEARLTAPIETVLFRILQEAVNNIAKHAEARRAHLLLEFLGDKVTGTVEDDGRGFDPEAAGAKGGVGLAGMQERASLVGGILTIASQPGQGTRISVSIPLGDLHA